MDVPDPPFRLAVAALLAVPGLVVAAAPGSAASGDQVWLRFDEGRVAAPFTVILNSGALVSRTAVVTDAAGAGRILATASSPGQGLAARFPAYSASGARAVVVVSNTGVTDGMNPGNGRLEFGGDLTLDAGTTAAATGSDNGNNVVQRGLFGDAAQFKLEVDAGRPTCRVKGATGAVQVTSTASVTPGVRYRVRCVRAAGANAVSVTVTSFTAAGTLGNTVTTTASAPSGSAVGPLQYASTVPLSVGGKVYVTATGGIRLMGSSDQFNGTVDNVTLRLG